MHDVQNLVKHSTKNTKLSRITNSANQVVFPILLAFFPKCPICWAAYLSVLGISGIQSLPYSPWLIPIIIGIMIFNLVLLYRKSKVRNGLVPFWISLTGTFLVGLGYLISNEATSVLGIVLIFISAILNSLSYRYWSKLSFFIMSIGNKMKYTIQIKKLKLEN